MRLDARLWVGAACLTWVSCADYSSDKAWEEKSGRDGGTGGLTSDETCSDASTDNCAEGGAAGEGGAGSDTED